MYYIAVRRRKLLATVRVQSSLIVTYIWSPSNRSKHYVEGVQSLVTKCKGVKFRLGS